MFFRERGRGRQDRNGSSLSGQVRVLVVGDSGVGKTSLVHLIINGFSINRPPQTVGCTVGVKHFTYGSDGSSSDTVRDSMDRDFFVELWDVSGHERYRNCRSLFYSQINGIIFIHDLSQRRTRLSLQNWMSEVAVNGTFSAPEGSGGPFGLPIPYLVIGNKVDIATKGEGVRGIHGDLIDAARQWVEKQGLLPSTEQLPLIEPFPATGGLISAAKEGRFDKEAVTKFFHTLIRRRYFCDLLDSSNMFSIGGASDEEPCFSSRCSPLPAQRNLTPPPTLTPQHPVSSHLTSASPWPTTSIPKRSDIHV